MKSDVFRGRKKNRGVPVSYSTFTCPDCGAEYTLARKESSKRKNGHIKDLYCPFCKRVTKHVEKHLND